MLIYAAERGRRACTRSTLTQLSTYPGSLSTPIVSVIPQHLHVLKYVILNDASQSSLPGKFANILEYNAIFWLTLNIVCQIYNFLCLNKLRERHYIYKIILFIIDYMERMILMKYLKMLLQIHIYLEIILFELKYLRRLNQPLEYKNFLQHCRQCFSILDISMIQSNIFRFKLNFQIFQQNYLSQFCISETA